MIKSKAKSFNYAKEMAKPSVMINMPEFFAEIKKKRQIRLVLALFSALLFVLLGWLITSEYLFGGGILLDSSVTLTVEVKPADIPDVQVSMDDKEFSGNPPYLILEPSNEYRTLIVEAPGYRKNIRDLKVDKSQIISITIEPIIEEIEPDPQGDLMLEIPSGNQ